MIAHFDCFSGISGDMALGAFVDLGVPAAWLKAHVARLPLDDFDLAVSGVERGGIRATRVEVKAARTAGARHWFEIRRLIGESPLPERVRALSLDIFGKIAVAEAGIHGCDVERVHFHEVGAVDSVVDIVGTALCVERLGITGASASPIPLGTGFVQSGHGRLPVPAPATLAILEGIPVYGSGVAGEMVTPTGAAIVAVLASRFGPLPEMVVRGTGYGAGSREFEDRPNLLRVVIGEETAKASAADDRILVVETSVDDMNPELFGFLMERLFAEGALDVCLIPVYMKKNRPGTLLQALCPSDRLESVSDCILSESTSLGVRYHAVERTTLEREEARVQTSLGEIRAKRVRDPRGNVRVVPEYEVCRRIAAEKGIPLREVYETVVRETGKGGGA